MAAIRHEVLTKENTDNAVRSINERNDDRPEENDLDLRQHSSKIVRLDL
jgi:hypothetical protein